MEQSTKSNTKRIVITILLVIAVLIAVYHVGYYNGQEKVTMSSVTKYIPLPIQTGGSGGDDLVPVREEMPLVPDLPVKSDTIHLVDTFYVIQKVDTLAIVQDFQKRRFYEKDYTLANYGKLSIFGEVQYNKLDTLYWSVQEYEKQTTIIKQKPLKPFVGVNYNTMGDVGVKIGTFKGDIGLEFGYRHNIKRDEKGFEFGALYSF